MQTQRCRIESLKSVIEKQQAQIEALQKVASVGAVWKAVTSDYLSCDGSSSYYDQIAENCCAVLAWISIQCVKNAGEKPIAGDTVSVPEFQLDLFAREVALQLSTADQTIANLKQDRQQQHELVLSLKKRCEEMEKSLLSRERQLECVGMQAEEHRTTSRSWLALYCCITVSDSTF